SVASMTVWHTFALDALGNPYTVGGTCDRDAATALLLLCSLDYRRGRRLIHDDRWRARRMLRMGRHVRGVAWDYLHAACSEYVEACTRAASRWRKGDEKPCTVPYQLHLVAYLTGGDPRRWRAAWDTPYAMARAVYDAYAEGQGDRSILSPRAQEMEDNWPEHEAAAVGVN
ncbi:MAG: hypothetical protein ABIH03_00740, partial [Pseudomonadota bacterium]